MRLLASLMAATAVIGAAAAAQAQTADAWYFGAQVGGNLAGDATYSGGGASHKADYDAGYGVLGQIGYNFGPIRLEAELGWRTNGVDSVDGVGRSGDVDVLSLMGNVYYDIPTGTAFVPYVGAGIGGAQVSADGVRVSNAAVVDGDDEVLAYQGIVGLRYDVSPGLSIKGDYRYLATQDPTFGSSTGTSYEGEYTSHAVMVGFIYRFGQQPARPARPAAAEVPPPPPPPPPPAPKPEARVELPRSYLVFFDWDSAVLTAEAAEILRQAATNIKAGTPTRIELVGHADRSGPDRYNMRLSVRRAEAVRAELARQGVSAERMSVVGKGETSPLVPTPDGVREPQNRRVEIILP